MASNYRQLTEQINNRINPDNIYLSKSLVDELSTISYNDVLVFVRMAMKGVDPAYTEKSKLAGENVKQHLRNEINNVEFKYQGSVMTDTHIKGHSDIDLLTISNKFYSFAQYEINEILNSSSLRENYYPVSIQKMQNEVLMPAYSGDSISDLKQIRFDCERILSGKYNICDITKPKSIKIKNLNLNREVDIVVANWYDDARSVLNNKGDNRGIQIYHKDTNSVGKSDFPFISIKKINERSAQTSGRLKRMIRFLKNVKAVTNQNIDLSSFDINAICYDIETNKYSAFNFYELVPILYKQLYSICNDQTHSDNVVSVDEREYIFRGQNEKLRNIRLLLNEVSQIHSDLNVRWR